MRTASATVRDLPRWYPPRPMIETWSEWRPNCRRGTDSPVLEPVRMIKPRGFLPRGCLPRGCLLSPDDRPVQASVQPTLETLLQSWRSRRHTAGAALDTVFRVRYH